MKKTITGIFVLICLGTQTQAQTDTSGKMNAGSPTQSGVMQQSTTFDYYPESNVYYNPKAKNYLYYNDSTSSWMSGQAVPQTYRFKNQAWNSKGKKSSVNFNGTDVWKDNTTHQQSFRSTTPPANNRPVNNQPINNKPINNQ